MNTLLLIIALLVTLLAAFATASPTKHHHRHQQQQQPQEEEITAYPVVQEGNPSPVNVLVEEILPAEPQGQVPPASVPYGYPIPPPQQVRQRYQPVKYEDDPKPMYPGAMVEFTGPQSLLPTEPGIGSSRLYCAKCNKQVVSRVKDKNSWLTWGSSVGCCLCGCILCSWVPFCIGGTKDHKHYCPECGDSLGIRENEWTEQICCRPRKSKN